MAEKTAAAPRSCWKRAKTPTMIQMEATECGAASLGVILGFFGKHLTLEELREKCGVSRDGSNALSLIKTARAYGLDAHGYKKELEELFHLQLPAILFWQFNHFIVLEGFAKNRVYINDPATGPRTITYRELDEGYTGVVLAFQPGPEFKKERRAPLLITRLIERLQGIRSSLLYLVLVAFCLVLPGLAFPAFTRVFIDNLFSSRSAVWETDFLLGLSAIAIGAGLLTYLQQHYLARIQQKLSISLSSRFLWHILRLPLSFYAQRFSGEIAYRVQLNEQVAQKLTGSLASTAIDLLLIAFYAVVMFRYDGVIASAGIAAALLNLGLMVVIGRSRNDAYARQQQEMGKKDALSINALQNIATLKATGSESDFFARWAGCYVKTVNASQEAGKKDAYLTVFPYFMQTLTLAFLLSFGAWRVMNGHLSVGMLMALQVLMLAFLQPVLRFVDFESTLQTLKTTIARLDDVMKNPIDELYKQAQKSEHKELSPSAIKLAGSLEFKEVTFGYSPLEEPLLKNLEFALKPGQRLALVGPTGCGKSTIARLCAGLYKPWSGEILYDGQGLMKLPRDLMTRSLAIVDQDIFLFAGTVRDNVTLWDPAASEIELIRACKDACIHETIIARDLGYDSMVADGGKNFSGGERQRLEIARALLSNPTILIMDEATSALDSEMERAIVDNIRRRGCTCILIAHRLSTIRDADEILVLDHGHVVERGAHEALKALAGHYRELVEKETVDHG